MHLWRRRVPAFLMLLVFSFLSGAVDGSAAASTTGVQSIIVEPGVGASPVVSLIRSARHSIRLEIYILSNRPIIQELADARQRGIDVRVLLEERPFGGTRYASLAYSLLRQAHVSVRWANEAAFRYTHEKAMVVDSRVAGIFSFNLSSSAFYSNREFGFIDHNLSDAQTIAAIFNADWNRRFVRLPSTHLVVSPYNSRSDFYRLIDGARRSLDIYAEEVADSAIENRLAAAKRRGVRVRIITSADSSGVEQLRRFGIAVSLMPSPYVHAKAIVADGQNLFVGSENISSTSLDDNRELGILLTSKSPASAIERTFARDWRNNPPNPPVSHPSGHGLAVRVSAVPPSVTRGQLLTITASTSPGASCTIRVTYPDGYVSRAKSLSDSKTAGASGEVSWSWHVGSSATGTSHALVTCDLGGAGATGSTTFVIR